MVYCPPVPSIPAPDACGSPSATRKFEKNPKSAKKQVGPTLALVDESRFRRGCGIVPPSRTAKPNLVPADSAEPKLSPSAVFSDVPLRHLEKFHKI